VTEQINIEEIKQKIIEKLEPSGWTSKLRGFIKSSDFDKIIQRLYDLRQDGKRFTPPLKTVFTAFEKCPVKNLKVVLIGQDPYPYINVADGMAFSCSITGKPQVSLKYIFHAIEQTVHQDWPTYQDPDLSRWSEQGVLLLNSALTCEIDKPGVHFPIWKDFMAYLIDMLNFTDSGLVFILLGKQAQELESLIGPNHYILKASHPASAAHNGTNIWDCNDVFNQTNKLITGNLGSQFKINW
jgi:uracil-DNA glycosylase